MRKIVLLSILSFSVLFNGLAQSPGNLDESLKALKDYSTNYPKEKVYIHVDRSYYGPGDDIWFKAYITIGGFNALSQFSKLIYVELIGPDNKVVQALRLPISAGISFGDFSLSENLPSGNYRVRAYTQWMRNFDEAYFFEKTITFLNPLSTATSEKSETNSRTGGPVKIGLFPESGYISYDLPNRVGVNVFINGEGLATKGWLKTQNGENIIEVRTGSNGIGSFVFMAAPDMNYIVSLEDENGNIHEHSLSSTIQSGYGMTIHEEVNGTLLAEVRIDESEIQGQDLNLIIQNQGEVFYALKLKAKATESAFKIPIANLGDGLNEITLFSTDMKPLAYRRFFNYPASRELTIHLDTDKDNYKTRDKVKVEITIGEQGDGNRLGSFSVAVTNTNKVPWNEQSQANIKSFLLLKSYIKGSPPALLSYFNGVTDQKDKGIDDLMLTLTKDEVWSSLKQRDPVYPVENSMKISGTVTSLNGKPEPHSKVTIYSNESGILLDTIANENGQFEFDQLVFYDNTPFVVQVRTKEGKTNLKVNIDSIPHQLVSLIHDSKASISYEKDQTFYLENNRDRVDQLLKSGKLQQSIMLGDVQIEGARKKVLESSNLNGPGSADQVITAEELSNCHTLEMCLDGRLMGVFFQDGKPYSTRSPDTAMSIVVDGLFMEGENITTIDPLEIETIEVLRSAANLAIYGSQGAAGLIIITTKRGKPNSADVKYAPGIVSYKPQGFYKIREFISPDYSTKKDENNKLDLRSTIYWKPNLVTDENGKTSFEFYTSDQPGKYRIVIEGLDLEGRLGSIIKEFEVN